MINFIKLINLIGRGKSNDTSEINLAKVGGDGLFWCFDNDPSAGVWCSVRNWQVGVHQVSGIQRVEDLLTDLFPVINAALFGAFSDDLVKRIHDTPNVYHLFDEIYPVVKVGQFEFALVGIDPEVLRHLLKDWYSVSSRLTYLTLPVVAGFLNERPALKKGQAYWLNLGTLVSEGEGIIWLNGPLATVQFKDNNIFAIKQLHPAIEFIEPPVYAQIGTVEIPIDVIINLQDEDEEHIGTLTPYSRTVLKQNKRSLAQGELIENDEGTLYFNKVIY